MELFEEGREEQDDATWLEQVVHATRATSSGRETCSKTKLLRIMSKVPPNSPTIAGSARERKSLRTTRASRSTSTGASLPPRSTKENDHLLAHCDGRLRVLSHCKHTDPFGTRAASFLMKSTNASRGTTASSP